MKICNKCKIEKNFIEFNKSKNSKDGHAYSCKECKKISNKEYRKNNTEKKKEHGLKWSRSENGKNYKKRYKLENQEKLYLRDREYQEKNKERIAKYQKEYKSKNREKLNIIINKRRIKRIETDPVFKLQNHIRKIILTIFKKNKFIKNKKTFEIIGCSPLEFRIHIESKFESWMSWENHGIYTGEYNQTWQLDHIMPISLASTIEDVYRLNHYTNFQPLCSKKNAEKRNNFIS